MSTQTITEIPVATDTAERFPGVTVLTVHAAATDRPAVARVAGAGWRELYDHWHSAGAAELLEHPHVQAYRDLCVALGIDPDRTPPSIQALVERGLRGRPPGSWPRINAIVDVVNIMAVRTLTSLGVFDADKVEGEVRLALATGVEPFLGLGAKHEVTLPPGELVLRDDKRVLSRFSRRDGVYQSIQAKTVNVIVLGCVVPGVDRQTVADALVETTDLMAVTGT
jgi:DNA/RNA-binding domain of Phe-tRNA-synthetase-like protein